MSTLKTIRETLLRSGDSCFIVKKGKRYLTIKNGELSLSRFQGESIAFESEEQIQRFLSVATLDTRNARIIGRSYGILPVSKP